MRVAFFAVLTAVLIGTMTGCSSASVRHAPPRAAAKRADVAEADVAEIEKLKSQGLRLNQQESYAAAARVLADALTKARALEPRIPLLEATLLGERANSLVLLRRTTEARALVAEAVSLITPGALPNDRRLFVLQMILAESHRYDDAPALAIAPFQRAIAIAEPHEAEMANLLVDALDRLATTLHRVERHAEADQMNERAYALAQRTPELRGRARALAIRLAFNRTTASGSSLELLRRNGGFVRVLTRYAAAPVDAPLDPTPLLADPPATAHPAAPASATSHAESSNPTLAPKTSSQTSSRTVSDAAAEVAAMRDGFRACYQGALAADPKAEGATRLTLRVGPDGQVAEVRAVALGLPVSTVDCVLQRAIAGRFAPPDGGVAFIAVPVTFIKQ